MCACVCVFLCALLAAENGNLRNPSKQTSSKANYKLRGCVHSDDSQPRQKSPLFTVYQQSKLRQNDMSPIMQFHALIGASSVTSLSLTVAINSGALLLLRLDHSNQEQKDPSAINCGDISFCTSDRQQKYSRPPLRRKE